MSAPTLQEAPKPAFLRPRDLAGELDVHVQTVMALIRRGELPAVKVGGQIRIPREAYQKFLEKNAIPAHTR